MTVVGVVSLYMVVLYKQHLIGEHMTLYKDMWAEKNRNMIDYWNKRIPENYNFYFYI